MVSSFPISFKSFFHGASLLLVMLAFVICFMALWFINMDELYRAPKNDCWAENSLAMYGNDNVLYCPNTEIVSSLQIVDTGLGLTLFETSERPEIADFDFATGSSQIYFSGETSNDEDDDETYWRFNFNHGSWLEVQVQLNTQGDVNMYFELNDKPLVTLPYDTDNHIFNVTEDGSYRFRIASVNETSGAVYFNANSTFYGGRPENLNSSIGCSVGLNCSFTFDFTSNTTCLNMFYPRGRNWGMEWSGYCILFVQQGWDKLWAGILVPSTVGFVVLVIILNVAVSAIFKAKKQEERDDGYTAVNVH